MKLRPLVRAPSRLLRAVGLNRAAWDLEFRAGVWDRGPRSSELVRLACELCNGGRLVEFGCGEGTLPIALPAHAFSDYLGYDVSAVAIRRARDRIAAAGVARVRFEQEDMARWNGDSGVSLIVAEEVLYYLDPRQRAAFLARCRVSLTSDGSLLVVVHDASKHAATIDSCRSTCDVKRRLEVDHRTYLVLH